MLCFISFYLGGRYTWHLCWTYIAFIYESKGKFFYRGGTARKRQSSILGKIIRVGEKISAVFFGRMLFGDLVLEIGGCGIRSKKIASKGVWGNGRCPQLYLPSAVAVAIQGYCFYLGFGVF